VPVYYRSLNSTSVQNPPHTDHYQRTWTSHFLQLTRTLSHTSNDQRLGSWFTSQQVNTVRHQSTCLNESTHGVQTSAGDFHDLFLTAYRNRILVNKEYNLIDHEFLEEIRRNFGGRSVASGTINSILVAIRMTIRIHEFFKRILYLLLRLLQTAKNKQETRVTPACYCQQ